MSDDITTTWRDDWARKTWKAGYLRPRRPAEDRHTREPEENVELRWLWDGRYEREIGAKGVEPTESHGRGEGDKARAKAVADGNRLLRALKLVPQHQRIDLRRCYKPHTGRMHEEEEARGKWIWTGPARRLLAYEQLKQGSVLSPAQIVSVVRRAWNAHEAFSSALGRYDRWCKAEAEEARMLGHARSACLLARTRAGVVTRAQCALDRTTRIMRWMIDMGLGPKQGT